ncbi:MAG: hypothetical protein JSS89_07995 [Bacteroidetes bacterium]|nr:hypothetical protein [Bacteroidota bacterium]
MKFFLVLIVGVCCTSCAWISGSDLRENIIVRVPPSTTVKDVYTGEPIPLNLLYTADSSIAPSVSLRNGRRHALQFTHDSGVSYRTLDLQRNWWGAFNAYSPAGVGFLVDQLVGTAYDITPRAIRVRTFDTLSAQQLQHIEDSLRAINRDPIPHSVIDHRTNFVASVWGTFAVAGPSYSDFPISPGLLGIGFAPIPHVMLLYEYGWMSMMSFPDLKNLPWGSYNSGAEYRSLGLCVQEPVYGLFASWRFGTGFTYERAKTPGAFEDRLATITHYSLGAGFYGQWGRVEYRVLRFTSWDANYANANLGLISHGLYFTLQAMF